ncbi:MAG: hypothetical protein DHS20C19_25320 [Acidimicrobiales bacterium]|nr:MAG: hypothetical protein DHS20C19_25320 [Acidimicrobiales bacterium]
MFSNIGGMEVLFVMVVALIVLGPTKLPEAARHVGKWVTEIRRISAGFQREFREAIQEPIIEAEARARGAVESTKKAVADPFVNPGLGSTGTTETTDTSDTDAKTADASDTAGDD